MSEQVNPIISKEEMAGLLGRSLSKVEDANFELYLEIAIIRIRDLICDELPEGIGADLKLVVARCFGVIASEQSATANQGVEHKQVEDFRIDYNVDAEAPMAAFIKQNIKTLAKYDKCQGEIMSGRVRHGERFRPL